MPVLLAVCYSDDVFVCGLARSSRSLSEFVVVDNDLAGHAGGDGDEFYWLYIQDHA